MITDVIEQTSSQPGRRWAPAALAAALAIALYAHTVGGTWIYDDVFHAKGDPRLASPRLWGQYLTQGYVPGGVDHLWRPLVSLSYAVQWQMTGERAWPFHLVNVLLHAAASALVAELARRLSRRVAVGLIAGLLFAAHPLHVEVVTYLVGRADSLCTIGAVGAVVALLRPLTVARALGVFGCVTVAVLSKEQGLVVPLILLAAWPLRRRLIDSATADDDPRARQTLVLMTLFATAAYVTYREHILPWYWETNLLDYATQPMIRSGPMDRVLIPFALLGRAVALLVFPARLSPEYGLAVITAKQRWADPYLYIGLASLVGVILLAWALCRRRAWTALILLLSAGLTYGIVSNVKLIGVVFAERLLYLPSAFALILAAMALARLPGPLRATVVAVVVVLFGVRGVTYAARWNDAMRLYETSVRDRPRSARLRLLLASELMRGHDLGRAREVVEEGLRYAPDYWKLWNTAGLIAAEQGRFGDALAAVDRAMELDPYVPDVEYVRYRMEQLRAATRPTTRP